MTLALLRSFDHRSNIEVSSECITRHSFLETEASIKMVLEAGYPNTKGFRKVVKATILVKKKPGMSDEDFILHYNHKHAQMAAPVLEKHNVITYSLVSLCLSQRSCNADLESDLL